MRIPTAAMPLRVRDYLPLQQGLRHMPVLAAFFFTPVRDYLPLQQGLRLSNRAKIVSTLSYCQRLSSITTRIKTLRSNSISAPNKGQRLSSITTRIKTEHFQLLRYFAPWSETIFHYNKD